MLCCDSCSSSVPPSGNFWRAQHSAYSQDLMIEQLGILSTAACATFVCICRALEMCCWYSAADGWSPFGVAAVHMLCHFALSCCSCHYHCPAAAACWMFEKTATVAVSGSSCQMACVLHMLLVAVLPKVPCLPQTQLHDDMSRLPVPGRRRIVWRTSGLSSSQHAMCLHHVSNVLYIS